MWTSFSLTYINIIEIIIFNSYKKQIISFLYPSGCFQVCFSWRDAQFKANNSKSIIIGASTLRRMNHPNLTAMLTLEERRGERGREGGVERERANSGKKN